MTAYAKKRELGLVPYSYSSEGFRKKAREIFGRSLTRKELDNDKRLLAERPRAQRYHRFTLPFHPYWVTGQYPWLGEQVDG